MGKFASIYDLNVSKFDEQVLLTLEYGDDNYEICIATNFDKKGLTAKISVGFENKDDAMEMLNTFSMNDALKFRKKMVEMLGVEY